MATINPQTVASPGPSLVYGLLNNDALIASRPETVEVSLTGSNQAILAAFTPATDVIQMQVGQEIGQGRVNSFAAGSNATAIILPTGGSIDLPNTPETALTAANFRFV